MARRWVNSVNQKYGIIYEIVCIKTNFKYIGQTISSLKKRWNGHCTFAFKTNSQIALAKAIREFGKENFQMRILCECESKEMLDKLERDYIKQFNCIWPNGYNMTNGGEGPCELTRQLISQRTKDAMALLDDSHKERQKEAMKDPELRKLISERTKENTPRGHNLSDEMKKRISDKLMGHKLSDERKKKISERTREAMKLKRESDPEWAVRQCQPKSEEQKRKISETLTGRKFEPLSEEHRKKISDANKLAWVEGRRCNL